jgi:hypothetical protein
LYYPARYNRAEYNQGAIQPGKLRLRLVIRLTNLAAPEFARSN